MNIQQIRDRYDPENDAHPVTWLEMQLAEEVNNLRNEVDRLNRLVIKIIEHLGVKNVLD